MPTPDSVRNRNVSEHSAATRLTAAETQTLETLSTKSYTPESMILGSIKEIDARLKDRIERLKTEKDYKGIMTLLKNPERINPKHQLAQKRLDRKRDISMLKGLLLQGFFLNQLISGELSNTEEKQMTNGRRMFLYPIVAFFTLVNAATVIQKVRKMKEARRQIKSEAGEKVARQQQLAAQLTAAKNRGETPEILASSYIDPVHLLSETEKKTVKAQLETYGEITEVKIPAVEASIEALKKQSSTSETNSSSENLADLSTKTLELEQLIAQKEYLEWELRPVLGKSASQQEKVVSDNILHCRVHGDNSSRSHATNATHAQSSLDALEIGGPQDRRADTELEGLLSPQATVIQSPEFPGELRPTRGEQESTNLTQRGARRRVSHSPSMV